MLTVSERHSEILTGDGYTSYYLVSILLRGSPRYLTNAPYNIDWQSNTYNNNSGLIQVIPPDVNGLVPRQIYQIELGDPTGAWRRAFENIGYGTKVKVEQVVEDPLTETIVADSITLYNGTYRYFAEDVGGRTTSGQKTGSPNIKNKRIIIECGGHYPRLDLKILSLTNSNVQHRYDPTDTAFDEVAESHNQELVNW